MLNTTAKALTILQLILPTNKRSPSFTISTTEDTKFIHVYYGMKLLEVLPSDRAHPAFRLLVARLYNTKVRVLTLAEVFDFDPKTMRSWGRALLSSNPTLLQNMLQGRYSVYLHGPVQCSVHTAWAPSFPEFWPSARHPLLLRKLKWDDHRLKQEPKGHPKKVELAAAIRSHTTVPLSWLAEHLHMGTTGYVWLKTRRHLNTNGSIQKKCS